MKIFISKTVGCNLNYQNELIYLELSEKYEITDKPNEADIIVFASSCSCTKQCIDDMINYINSILECKKSSAITYLTGCITREFINNEYLQNVSSWINNNIDYVIPHNKPYMLLKMINEEYYKNLDIDSFGCSIDYNKNNRTLYIGNGCMNKCSFCKLSYQNYPLNSASIDKIYKSLDETKDTDIDNITLIGTNICQYGYDLYGKYRLHEIIEYIEKLNNIKYLSLIGFAYKDAIHSKLDDILKDSSKISYISGSLESGSNRILKLMQKGFMSEEIINFINHINNPSRIIAYDLNIIAGFPTETITDIRDTLEVLKEIDPYRVNICTYTNSPFVLSNKYPQLNRDNIKDNARIYDKVLRKRGVITQVID